MATVADLVARSLAASTAAGRGVVRAAALSIAWLGRLALAPLVASVVALALVLRVSPSTSRLAAHSGLALIVAVPVLLVGFLAATAFTNPYVAVGIRYDHQRSSATELFDADGRWLGIIPPATFADWSDGEVLPEDHAAVPLVDIPPVWRACVVQLEDQAFDGLSRLFGFDPLAIVKAGWYTLTSKRARGASTLYMQVIRSLDGQLPGAHESAGGVVMRKAAELVGARALVAMIESGEVASAERFVGMHLPLVIGTVRSGFGGPIYGVALAARVLFDKIPADLTMEEQALLAAAVKRPIVLAPPGDEKGRATAQRRFAAAVARADHCLGRLDPAHFDAGAVKAARLRLSAMVPPEPRLDDELRPLLPRAAVTAWRVLVNPVRRARHFAGHELTVLPHELAQRLGADWRGYAVAVHLTTSATESRRFVDSVAVRLAGLERRMPGLLLPLVRTESVPEGAEVVIACADPQGRLRRIYSSQGNQFWSRRAPVGSIAKIAAAVALGTRDGPETGYCAARAPGLPGGTGTDCSDPSAWLSARDAFARSSNTAIHWALRHRVSADTLARVAAALDLPSFGDTPAATALTLGTFEQTPAEMLRLMQRIGAGIAGAPDPATSPTVIGRLVLDGAHGPAAVTPSEARPRLAEAVSRQTFGRAAELLAGTTRPGGTLHALASEGAHTGDRLIAKTGTVSLGGQTAAIHIAGASLRDGRAWPFVVTVGAPSSKTPLGLRLTAGRFATLAAAALCSSAGEGARTAATSQRLGRTP